MKNRMNVNQEKLYKQICFIFSLATAVVFTMNILYHMQVAKLSPLELVLIGTCLELTCFIFEVPTGIIADKYSRKLSVIIGFMFIGCGFILEGSFPKFIFIALAQVIWGIGFTCISGALDAWVVDETGNEEVFISGAKYAAVGNFLGIGVSFILAQIALNVPVIVGGLILISLACVLQVIMQEKPYQKNTEDFESSYLSKTFKAIFYTFTHNRILTILFIIALFFGLYSEGFDRLWGTLILQTAEFIGSNGSYVFGGVAAITSIISFMTLKAIDQKIELININVINKRLIALALVIVGVLALMSVFENGYILIACVVIINLCRQLIEPLESVWLNKLITDGENRATLLSLKGQVGALGQIASGPLMGMFSMILPLRLIFLLSAVIFWPVIPLFKKAK